MIEPDQIPQEAMEAMRRFLADFILEQHARAALVAALSAWPGAYEAHHRMINGAVSDFELYLPVILPLPTKGNA